MTQTFFSFDVDPDIKRDQQRLAELALELAIKAGRNGVTVSDVRVTAEARGILTGQESAARIKRLNLGAVMAQPALFATDRFRRSDVPRAHGNLNRVHVVREFAEVA